MLILHSKLQTKNKKQGKKKDKNYTVPVKLLSSIIIVLHVY